MVSAGRVTDRVVKGGVGPPDEDILLTAFMNGINRACSNHKTQTNAQQAYTSNMQRTKRFRIILLKQIRDSLTLIKCTLDMDLDL